MSLHDYIKALSSASCHPEATLKDLLKCIARGGEILHFVQNDGVRAPGMNELLLCAHYAIITPVAGSNNTSLVCTVKTSWRM